jgi:hypothetical protein
VSVIKMRPSNCPDFDGWARPADIRPGPVWGTTSKHGEDVCIPGNPMFLTELRSPTGDYLGLYVGIFSNAKAIGHLSINAHSAWHYHKGER